MTEDQEKRLPVKAKDLLEKTYRGLVEGLGGLAASDRKDISLSLSHLLQRLRGAGFLEAVKHEWNELRKKGRIKDDYVESDQHLSCLHELLDALDTEIVDKTRFDILKKVFLVAASEKRSTRDEVLPQQLMKLARSLSSGEILVLEATYRIAKSGSVKEELSSAGEWLETVAKESGLKFSHLVELHEETLMRKYLITARRYSDRSGVILDKNCRLTQFAMELCEFIASYDDLKVA